MRHINDVLKLATIENAKAKYKRDDLTDGGDLARGRAVLGVPLPGDLLRQPAGGPSLAQALQGAR